jgi:hypothetical protein
MSKLISYISGKLGGLKQALISYLVKLFYRFLVKELTKMKDNFVLWWKKRKNDKLAEKAEESLQDGTSEQEQDDAFDDLINNGPKP